MTRALLVLGTGLLLASGCSATRSTLGEAKSLEARTSAPFDLRVCNPRLATDAPEYTDRSTFAVFAADATAIVSECSERAFFVGGAHREVTTVALKVTADHLVEVAIETTSEDPFFRRCVDEGLGALRLPPASLPAGTGWRWQHTSKAEGPDALVIGGGIAGTITGTLRESDAARCHCFGADPDQKPPALTVGFRLEAGDPRPHAVKVLLEPGADPDVAGCVASHVRTLELGPFEQTLDVRHRFTWTNTR